LIENHIKSKYPADRYLPVLISEITRMTHGYYCVAGWDVHGHRMVRPLNSMRFNWKLGTDRAIFSVGHLINCNPTGMNNNVFPHATEDLPLSESPTLLESYDEPTVCNFLSDKAFRSIS